ncbi:hypothetical protein CB1_002576001 [Camelus ferus]|nr:hypothetical protein CB1_002576001 [Camelus ferus]
MGPRGQGGRTSNVTMLPLSTFKIHDMGDVKTSPPERGALPSEDPDDPPKKRSRKKRRMSARRLPICPLGGDAATPPGEDEEGPDVPIVQQIKWAITLGSYSDLLLCKSQHCGRCFVLPSVCFAFYLETDDSDSDSDSSSEPSKPASTHTSPSKPAGEYQEIQAWECPLCCLSVFCLS